MSDIKRVYHPSANAWKDVPEGDVEKWSKAGWSKSKPKHVDDSDAHPAGDFYSAPVAADPAPEKSVKKADAPSTEPAKADGK